MPKEKIRNKNQKEELFTSEKRYETLIENLPQKIFLKDKNLVYISCNNNYARDLKIPAGEISGKTDFDFYPKELAEKYRADDKKIMEFGEMEEIEEKYLKDGQEMYVNTIKTPVRDEKGNIIGILGIFWDITERKRKEEELKNYIDKMEKINKLMVGRELKIDELKKEVEDLKNKIAEINKANSKK
ncbi:MAG: PAS domain-containing protein [Candidatus Pacebacteria bacterium]|nr:PAS domain-containing protein [Candidatus Paceibacterota bacterium]